MSTKVAILCEDHTYDRYILEPIVESALKSIGIPRPRVVSITNPRISGFDTLLERLCEVVARYERTASAIVVAFDLDGDDGSPGRRDKLARARGMFASCSSAPDNVIFLACRQGAEVYAIWGSRNDVKASWSAIRLERDPKERYFEPLLRPMDSLAVDGGRTRLVGLSLKNGWQSLRSACDELADLERDLARVLEA